jgi:hypothetical protein
VAAPAQFHDLGDAPQVITVELEKKKVGGQYGRPEEEGGENYV